jgi:hypothetical protein
LLIETMLGAVGGSMACISAVEVACALTTPLAFNRLTPRFWK